MKIKYNAPTTLTFSFFCALIVLVDQLLINGLTRAFFSVPSSQAFNLTFPLHYLRLFTHIAGHADWNHLMANLAYILLLGPMLEETYGSLTMFLMMIVTGFVTGVLNACFFPQPLLGASGIVFMMILLASFTNNDRDEVPLTFILIVFLYLGREVINAFTGDDISQFAHLAGGLCGSLFGFFKPSRRQSRVLPLSAKKTTPPSRIEKARTPDARTPTARLAAPRSTTPKDGEKKPGKTATPKKATLKIKPKSVEPKAKSPAPRTRTRKTPTKD